MYNSNCPDKTDFHHYLNGELPELKIVAFDNHIKECELCKEAVEGYKAAFKHSLSQEVSYQLPKPKYHLRRRLLPYAAAVTLLAALLFSQINKNWKSNTVVLADNSELVVLNNKAMMHKATVDYWYVGSEGRISYNDQVVTAEQLKELKSNNTEATKVFIEIDATGSESVKEVISAIKEQVKVPVFVFSKNKSLKR